MSTQKRVYYCTIIIQTTLELLLPHPALFSIIFILLFLSFFRSQFPLTMYPFLSYHFLFYFSIKLFSEIILFICLHIYVLSSLVYESQNTHFPLEVALISTLKTKHKHCRYILKFLELIIN